MSNKEKAKELAYNTVIYDGNWECLGSVEKDESICMRCNIYHRLLKMAKWKDEQYLKREIELLEGLKNEIATTTERAKVLRRIRLLKNKLQ